MNWSAYTEYSSLDFDTELEIFQYKNDGIPTQQLKNDDTFDLEFPNNERANGRVTAVNGKKLTVEISKQTWHLKLLKESVLDSTGKLSNYYKIEKTS